MYDLGANLIGDEGTRHIAKMQSLNFLLIRKMTDFTQDQIELATRVRSALRS
jgi:hypothetical protein